jgi:hypothetical protein
MLFGRSNQEELDGRDMWHVWGRRDVHTTIRWGNEGKRISGRPKRRWKDNIKLDPQDIGCGLILD